MSTSRMVKSPFRGKNRAQGFCYSSKIAKMGGAALAALLSLQLSLAQSSGAIPEPAPTDAVKESGQTLRVEGVAKLDQGTTQARYAALLDAYDRLLSKSLKRGLFEGSWTLSKDGHRFFRVDSEHPNPDLVSWLSRAKVVGERQDKRAKYLTLESAATGTVAAAEPELRAMRTLDVDGDGLSDVVGIGYDGSVYVLKSAGKGNAKVALRSDSYAFVELVDTPGYDRVITLLPQDVESVETTADGAVRFLVSFEKLEMVNGYLLGQATEKREILLPLKGGAERFRFQMTEPPDFAHMGSSDVEIRGSVISDKLLSSVVIRHNGVPAWESPASLGIRALQFNLERELEPGWNSFRISAGDVDGYSQVREIWLEGPQSGRKVRGGARKRAILVSLDRKFKEEKLLSLLQQYGFAAESITVLEGEEATAQRVLTELRNNKGADELFFYCEAETAGEDPLEGKTLSIGGVRVTPSELAKAIEAGDFHKAVGVFYTEIPRDQRAGLTPNELWRDTASFLERVGGDGRLMLASVESMEQGSKSQRRASRERLVKALESNGGDDMDRLLGTEDSHEVLFRGWMYGTPVLGR